MCNGASVFGFGYDIGVHNFDFSDMVWILELMKKFPVGSGLQNFHIRAPLVQTRRVPRKLIGSLSGWPVHILSKHLALNVVGILYATKS